MKENPFGGTVLAALPELRKSPGMKTILDATCGGRMMWFNKVNPSVLFVDKEVRPKGCVSQQPNFSVSPDVIADFTALPFDDERFSIVVFDPPHAIDLKPSSFIYQKFGTLEKDWQKVIRAGFEECYRVLKPDGVLVFKWNEIHISIREVLEVLPIRPLFGHTTAKSGKTKWFLFHKPALS